MGFETFEPLPTEAPRRVATIRFLGKGRVGFNAAAARLLSDWTHMRLLFDSDTDQIGLEPTDASDSLGYKITHSDSSAVITAPGFADRYDLHFRYAITLNGGENADSVPLIAQVTRRNSDDSPSERRAVIL